MPSSTFARAVSTASRLHSRPTRAWRVPRFPLASRSFPRFNHTSSAPPKDPSYLVRFIKFASLATFAFGTGFLFKTSSFVTEMVVQLPTDAETVAAYTPSDDLSQMVEAHIENHPLSISLREDPEYIESRPYLKIPEKIRAHSLTAGTLSNAGGIVVPPVVFNNKNTNTLVSIMYLGPNVCGHPGLIHGGFLATLLDEGMGRCAFPVLPNKVGVTANLNVDYRRPAVADSYFVMRAQVVRYEGRKAWVEARIETLPEEGKEPDVLVEAKSLFIEPKGAAALAQNLQKLAN